MNKDELYTELDYIRNALYSIHEYLNDNKPVQASRALQRAQIPLGRIYEGLANDKQ